MRASKRHIGAAIVGLGNILLADDGVGVHAVRRLWKNAPDGVVLAEVGTAIFDALDLLESVDVVVAIDAVQADGRPGSIHCFDLAEADMRNGFSLHDFGIAAAVQSLPAESRPAVTVVGVEPAAIEYGLHLSPAVQAVLPQVIRTARTTAAQRIERFSERQECNCENL